MSCVFCVLFFISSSDLPFLRLGTYAPMSFDQVYLIRRHDLGLGIIPKTYILEATIVCLAGQ